MIMKSQLDESTIEHICTCMYVLLVNRGQKAKQARNYVRDMDTQGEHSTRYKVPYAVAILA